MAVTHNPLTWKEEASSCEHSLSQLTRSHSLTSAHNIHLHLQGRHAHHFIQSPHQPRSSILHHIQWLLLLWTPGITGRLISSTCTPRDVPGRQRNTQTPPCEGAKAGEHAASLVCSGSGTPWANPKALGTGNYCHSGSLTRSLHPAPAPQRAVSRATGSNSSFPSPRP